MKKLILAAAALFMLATAPVAALHAQTATESKTTQEDAKASLAISQGIISILGDLAKDFKEYKGDLVTTTKDGTSVYKVKGLEQMQADDQFIAVRKDGVALYMASYKGSTDADVKKLASSFAAFVAGITTNTNNDGNFTVEQDKEKSVDKTLVYLLKVKGTKVGSYTMDVEKKEGTMVIAFL